MTKVEGRACFLQTEKEKKKECRKQLSPSRIRTRLSRRLHVWLLVLLLVRRLIQVKTWEAEVSLRMRMRIYRGVSSCPKTLVTEASNSQESRSSSKPSGLLIGDDDSSQCRPKLSYIGGGDVRVEMGDVALEVALVRASGDEPPEM